MDRMIKLFVLVMWCAAGTFPVLAGNPLLLPEYVREYRVEFSSQEEAAAATMTLSALPPGKNVLFSCRWDDSNDRHLKTAEVMRETGCPGTFYLCQAGPNYYAGTMKTLVDGGNTVGNHTLSHPRLTEVGAARLWNEIFENRYLYEVRSQLPVTAFALPFCAWRRKDDPTAAARIGKALRHAGMLGAPEYFRDQAVPYGYPVGSFVNSFLITPGDREPDEERFFVEVEQFLRQGATHITLGMHSNHTPAGLEKLRRILASCARRSDWHCCTENEAIARISGAAFTRVEKLHADGAVAVFRLTGPTPASLGWNAPLTGCVGDRRIELPHTMPMPKAIGLFLNRNNLSGRLFKCAERVPFRAGLFLDPAGSTVLRLENTGGVFCSATSGILRLPGENIRFTIPELEPGRQAVIEIPFHADALVDGEIAEAAELDVEAGEEIYRLWIATRGNFRE